jgi:hypothetical protein
MAADCFATIRRIVNGAFLVWCDRFTAATATSTAMVTTTATRHSAVAMADRFKVTKATASDYRVTIRKQHRQQSEHYGPTAMLADESRYSLAVHCSSFRLAGSSTSNDPANLPSIHIVRQSPCLIVSVLGLPLVEPDRKSPVTYVDH